MAVTNNFISFKSEINASVFMLDVFKGDWIKKLPEVEKLPFAERAFYISNLDDKSTVNINWNFGVHYNTVCIKSFDISIVSVEGTIELTVDGAIDDESEIIELDLTTFKYECEVDMKEGNCGLYPEIVELNLESRTGLIKFR